MWVFSNYFLYARLGVSFFFILGWYVVRLFSCMGVRFGF